MRKQVTWTVVFALMAVATLVSTRKPDEEQQDTDSPNTILFIYNSKDSSSAKRIEKIWKKIVKAHSGVSTPDIAIPLIDVGKGTAILDRFDIKNYEVPSIVLVKDGKQYKYEGKPDPELINKFILRYVVQSVLELPSIADRVYYNNLLMVYIGDPKLKEFEVFKNRAKKHLDIPFLSTLRTENSNRIVRGQDGLIFMIKRKGIQVIPFQGEVEEENLEKFIITNR